MKKCGLRNLKIIDNLMIAGAILYVVLPVAIFFMGWIKLPLAIVFAMLLAMLSVKIYMDLRTDVTILMKKDYGVYWLFSVVVIFLWVYLSGIGGYSHQNWDFWARNAIFRDLSTYEWPVIYDLSLQSDKVQTLVGSEKVAFSYYYTWWLSVAAVSKIFSLGEAASNFLLFLWASLGVFLVVYCLNRLLGKCSYWVLIVMIFFGGMDAFVYYLLNQKITLTEHLEWWAVAFQYSSNSSQLFWVFNQSIPIWLIMSLFLLSKTNKYDAGLCSLAFAYSPWATFGVVPYVIVGAFKKKPFKNVFNLVNIVIPSMILLVYGSYYLSSTGSTGGAGMIFSKYPNQEVLILILYVCFVFVEFGMYYLLGGKQWRKNDYYVVTLISLIILPLFYIRDENFTMRASIPALFLTMIYIIRYLREDWKNEENVTKKRLWVVILLIGTLASTCEIGRSIHQKFSGESGVFDPVVSFGDIQAEDDNYINLTKEQFYICNYEDSVFFKYLGK